MKLGLIGYPLGHSWSPQIHSFFLKEDCYDLYELKEEELEEFFRNTDLDGFNVTIPYKQKVMEYLDTLSPSAETIGAVNTVVHRNGAYAGYNTDYEGFLEMLKENGIAAEGRHAAILGTGGVSKAIACALLQLGASFDFVSRVKKPGAISYEELYEKQADYQLLVNATPVGMSPRTDCAPVDVSRFSRLESVVDVIANPLRTKLCFDAWQRGIRFCGGFEMLVRQALAADRYFTDREMDRSQVKACMDALLKERRNLVLIGMPTSGKSTIAKMIAEKTGRPLIEMDQIIEERLGTTIRECFEKKGEAYFRALETDVCKEVGAEGAVISCGGGVIKNRENMQYLSANGMIFWIDRDPELLFGSKDRPLSRSKSDIETLYEQRRSLYERFSDIRIANNASMEQAASAILAAVGETL